MAGKKIISWSEEKTKKDANTMKRSSGVRKRIRAKDAKYRSRGQARGGKDKGFGEQKGKIQSCQAMQIQLQAPIQAIQHQASPGETVNYRRLLQLRPRLRLSLRVQKDCSTTISRIVSNCITRCGSKWLD